MRRLGQLILATALLLTTPTNANEAHPSNNPSPIIRKDNGAVYYVFERLRLKEQSFNIQRVPGHILLQGHSSAAPKFQHSLFNNKSPDNRVIKRGLEE